MKLKFKMYGLHPGWMWSVSCSNPWILKDNYPSHSLFQRSDIDCVSFLSVPAEDYPESAWYNYRPRKL